MAPYDIFTHTGSVNETTPGKRGKINTSQAELKNLKGGKIVFSCLQAGERIFFHLTSVHIAIQSRATSGVPFMACTWFGEVLFQLLHSHVPQHACNILAIMYKP